MEAKDRDKLIAEMAEIMDASFKAGMEEGYTKGFDKSYYWDHLVLPNCTRLLKVAFPKIGWDTLTYDLIRQQRICY